MPQVGPNMTNTSMSRGSGGYSPPSVVGVPTDGTSGYGAGRMGVGTVCRDTLNGDLYENQGTEASPTWVKIDS